MPYISINKKEHVLAELDAFVINAQYNALFDKIRFWLHYAESIRNKNRFEYDNIKEIITEAWNGFRNKIHRLPNDDDEINAQILDEDIPIILR